MSSKPNERPFSIGLGRETNTYKGACTKELRRSQRIQTRNVIWETALESREDGLFERRSKVKIPRKRSGIKRPRSDGEEAPRDPQKQRVIQQGLNVALGKMMVSAHQKYENEKKKFNEAALAFEKEDRKQERELAAPGMHEAFALRSPVMVHKLEEEARGQAWTEAWKDYKRAQLEHQRPMWDAAALVKDIHRTLLCLKIACSDLRGSITQTLNSQAVKKIARDMSYPFEVTKVLKRMLEKCHQRWLQRLGLAEKCHQRSMHLYWSMYDAKLRWRRAKGDPAAKKALFDQYKTIMQTQEPLHRKWYDSERQAKDMAKTHLRVINMLASLNKPMREYWRSLDPKHTEQVDAIHQHLEWLMQRQRKFAIRDRNRAARTYEGQRQEEEEEWRHVKGKRE